jgi:hypothetical protein
MVAGDSARGLVISPTDEAQQEEILVSRYRKFLVKKNEDLSFFDLQIGGNGLCEENSSENVRHVRMLPPVQKLNLLISTLCPS